MTGQGRALAFLLLPCALMASPARGADTTWTGLAGQDRPFWDLGTNWSAGPPASDTTRALLGGNDTTIRQGSYVAGSVLGTGRLTLRGGSLQLGRSGSSLGHLEFQGGELRGPGGISVGSLAWRGGSVTSGDPSGFGATAGLTVRGAAELLGTGTRQAGPLTFLGATTWHEGPSRLESYAPLGIGPTGRFSDRPGAEGHSIDTGAFRVQGDYLKSGSGTTTYAGWEFRNEGRFLVQQGSFSFEHGAGDSWTNAGRIELAPGSSVDVGADRYVSYRHSGSVRVGRDASFSIDTSLSTLESPGQWQVERGGELTFRGWLGNYSGQDYDGDRFTGAIRNDGVLRFRGGGGIFAESAPITGQGRVEVLEGGLLSLPRTQTRLAELRVDEAASQEGAPPAPSRVVAAGGLTLDRLEWGEGLIEAGGPVTVLGQATLSKGAYRSDETGESWQFLHDKFLSSDFDFRGSAQWAGDADLTGPGTIRIAPGARFEDRNPQGVPDDSGAGRRPTRIAVAGFRNEGSYLKTGPGATDIAADFRNTGTVRAQDAGALVFAGRLDNTGTLEAVRSRIAVSGSLAQWAPQQGRLGGGSYVARDGTVELNLGGTPLRENAAQIVLDGPKARLMTSRDGRDLDALGALERNSGRLALLNGAALQTASALVNTGALEVGAGSRLMVGGRYTQSGSDAVTRLAGELGAASFEFLSGRLELGLGDGIGKARLSGGDVSFADLLFAVDIGSPGAFELLEIAGSARLGGRLLAEFGSGSPVPGTYRILSAAGGITGTFAGLATDLDPDLYRLSLVQAGPYLDLHVAAVPEPQTWALLAAGLGVLTLCTRKRRVGTA